MKESKFQAELIRKLQATFPGCIVVKNDPTYIQGIPDLLVLYKDSWAALECKKRSNASHRPNQDYYIDKMTEMSFASFIFPENEEEVFEQLKKHWHTEEATNGIQQTPRTRRATRSAKPK